MVITDIEWLFLDPGRPFAPQSRYRIGLVVRGMVRPGATPALEGHADGILSTGEPVGFFMSHSAEEALAPTEGCVRGSVPAALGGGERDVGDSSGDLTTTGAVLTAAVPVSPGQVYRHPDFLAHRPAYVSLERAAAAHCVSTLMAIDATRSEAQRFDQAWVEMARNPGMFGLIGWNCATHAAFAFARAGLLTHATRFGLDPTGEIAYRDTPANLFRQLVRGPANGRMTLWTGQLGFESIEGSPCFRVRVAVPDAGPGTAGATSTSST
jgi:hypothetical protein